MTDEFDQLIDETSVASRNYAADSCRECDAPADVHIAGIGEPSGSREAVGFSLCGSCFREDFDR